MTVITLTGFEEKLGLLTPIAAGTVSIEYVRGGAPASARVDGSAVIFPRPSSVAIVAGQVGRQLDLAPTLGIGAAKWLIYPEAGNPDIAFILYTQIPESAEPVAFGDLVIVDPNTYLPIDDFPDTVRQLLAEAEQAMQTTITRAEATLQDRVRAEDARGAAEAAQGAAEGARDVAVGAKTDLVAARDAAAASAADASASAQDADASRIAAAGSASDAAAHAADSLEHANDSDGFRGLSAGAAENASSSAAAAELSRAQALHLLEQMEALRDQPNGYLILDPQGLIPATRLPLGAMTFQGVWNAATNTPALANGTGQRGQVYAVTVAGQRDLGSGSTEFLVGDQLVHDGTRWHKIDNTDQVLDVNGRRGSIVLDKTDVGLSNVDNTADAEKPVSNAQRTELNKTVIGGSIVGDNLVLTLAGGGQVVAGNVRGPQGIKGDAGDLASSAASTASATLAIVSGDLPRTRIFTLTANLTISIASSPASSVSGTITLIFKQAATGSPFTATFPASITWSGPQGTPAPTMPTQAGAEMTVHLFWTGQRWQGVLAGVFLP